MRQFKCHYSSYPTNLMFFIYSEHGLIYFFEKMLESDFKLLLMTDILIPGAILGNS